MNNISLVFENPWLLLVAIPSLGLILLPFLLLPPKRRKNPKKIISLALHLLIVTFLVLILAGFKVVTTSEDQAVILLVDFSDSIDNVQDEIVSHTEELLDIIDEKTPVGVVVFGDNSVCALELTEGNRKLYTKSVKEDATNIADALEYAATLLSTDKAGHIIILSDGKETDGDAESSAKYLASQGVRIDAVYFDTTTLDTPEMQVSSFLAPDGSYIGEEVAFSIEIKSNVESKASLRLYDNDTLVNIELHDISNGTTNILMNYTPSKTGIHSFRIEVDPDNDNDDTLSKNNEAYACLKVSGASTILILTDTIAHASGLKTILSVNNDVTVSTAGTAPTSIIQLCNYDAIILSNVDYSNLPKNYDELLETYVSVYGRSLLAVGGSNTFMYGNMSGTKIEELLPVTFTLSEDQEGNSVALMLVLDCSLSMSNTSTYLSVAKQGAIKCVEALSDNDFVGVVSFNRSAYLKSSLVSATGTNKESVSRIISGLTTSQGTYYTEAIKLAQNELNKSTATVKHIIFLSDGNPSDSGYLSAVKSCAANGISVTTIGLGYSSSILESMASSANGRYYYVSSAKDLPNIMLSETEQVTVSSFITGEFTPVIAKESDLTADVVDGNLPLITGYLGTTIKEDATAYITTDEGHPIYAAWPVGLGTVSCFTSDLYGNWSQEWFNTEIGQLVIENMIDTTVSDVHKDSTLDVEVNSRGKTCDIKVTTSGLDASDAVSIVLSYGNESDDYVLSETSPGIYEGQVKTSEVGIYNLMVIETDTDLNVVDSLETAIAVSYSTEYDAFKLDGKATLESICDSGNGKIFSDLDSLAKVSVSSIDFVFNPMILLSVLSLIFMIIDIAVRKLNVKLRFLKKIFK